MPKLLLFLFLLTDSELLPAILRWGLSCGLVLVVTLCAVAAGSTSRRRNRRKTPSPADFS